MEKDELTRDGHALVKAWLSAEQRVTRLRNDLVRAEIDEREAGASLAMWLMPADAQVGERFCVWYLDSLLCAELLGPGVTAVTVRTRGRMLGW